MKRIFTLFLIDVAIAIVLLSLLAGCQKENLVDIEVIYVSHQLFENTYINKIDLVNKVYSSTLPINTSKNNGNEFVCDLDDDKIETFRRNVKEYDFLSWEGEYKWPGEYYDGHMWSITICFSDSTEKTVYGHMRYPETWNEMSDAFERLTDSYVLGKRSNTPPGG